jgi:anti-anti-sigma regulatory factor
MELASQSATGGAAEAALTIDRIVEGQITCLRMSGIINESFDGKRVASTIKAQTLVLELGEVKRVSSFGIREWSDFIQAVEKNVQRIIAVEVPPKVVDQLNMVAQFLGSKGSVYSFYAPYRCDYCDVDSRVLLVVDRDRAAIMSHQPPERTCESCSRPEYFDEDAATFFSFFGAQPNVEIGASVVDFLSSRLKYSVAGVERRLQIDKQVDGKFTWLKLTGNLDGAFPSNKIAEGLEGSIVVDVSGVGTIDLAGAAEWRNFVVQAKASAERIVVVGCPPILLERLNRQGDLGDVVVSFSMPYSCQKCATTSSQTIDVAEHYDILKFATPPEMKCPQCKSATLCSAPESLLSRLRTLTKPELDPELKKFIKLERKPPKDVVAAPKRDARPPRMGLWLGLIFMALVAAGVLMFLVLHRQQQALVATHNNNQDGLPRPTWITADTPLVGYCNDLVNRMGCVGVSPYLKNRDTAEVEAGLTSLEAMVNALTLRIDNPAFSSEVASTFEVARADALTNLESKQADPNSTEYAAALEKVRDARKRVADSFRKTGGAAAPPQKSGWFWERYGEGDASEFLVFVRYDLESDAMKNLIQEYTVPVDVAGTKVVTAYPQLAWKRPGVISGGFVLDPGPLAARGLARGDIIVAINGADVRDSTDVQTALTASASAPIAVLGADGQRRDLK